MVIDLVDALGYQQLAGDMLVAQKVVAQVGPCDQGDIGAPTQHHQQVAVMGVGRRGVVVSGEILGVGIEVGELVVIAAEQRQALAAEVAEVTLLALRQALGDEDFGIFQAHVDAGVGNVLPAPIGVFEDRHVHPALLEIAKTTGNGGGYQHEPVVALQGVEGLDQLRQQAGVGPGFRAHRVGRKVRGTNAHQLCSLGR
ncbi:hypothetical protein D3C84_546030 [compost metagenome]